MGIRAETSQAGRGYTNLLTGSLRLLDLPFNTLFKYVMEGRLPALFLSSFLHEATHFWCMASDYGSALAMLQMRLHHNIDNNFTQRSVRDYIALTLANTALQPLLEGMALFAEFDTFPGNSKVWASPTYWCGWLFRSEENIKPNVTKSTWAQWMDGQIRSWLFTYRDSDVAQQRKTDVLMRSFEDDVDNYLLGYWAVKHLWRHAAGQTPSFYDRDLFLSFLQSWIFQDWVMIGDVLNEEIDSQTLAASLSRRLQERLNQLATQPLEEEASLYEREIDTGRRDAQAMLRALSLEQNEVLSAQRRYRAFLDEINNGLQGDGEDQSWFLGDYATLQHRHRMLRLALEEVQIEVNEFDRVIVWKKGDYEADMRTPKGVYLASKAPREAERGVTPGWVALYFLPEHLRMFLIAMRENQPMLRLSGELLDESEMQMLEYTATKVAATEEGRSGIQTEVRRAAEALMSVEDAWTIETYGDHIRDIYSNYALDQVVGETDFAEIKRLLSRRGIYDLLEKDGDLLVALARMTLHPIYDERARELTTRDLTEVGIDAEAAFQKIVSIQAKTVLPICEPLPDGSFWFRV